MDETSKMYDNQVTKLLSNIDKYLVEMDGITAEIREKRDLYNTGNFVNYKEFTTRQRALHILNKKIKECVSSIASISEKIEYEEADFADDVNMVKFRSEITRNTIPKSSGPNVSIGWQVTQRNVGFSSWNSTNAHLEVHVVKNDSFFDETYIFTLSPSDEILLGQEKLFSVQIPGLGDGGAYSVDIYMTNGTYDFERKYNYSLYITN
ncbi:MAG: hypothetical protein K0R00_170 [Herbinix sp.]|jgi:hypothetical protein|nr:hypothetical protein [Herbinix sp.]